MKRNTVQRQIILETLQRFDTHPTVEEVYIEVHKKHSTISKVTVYRNLRQLSNSREIQQVVLPDNLERYDKRPDNHYHYKCQNCDALLDVDIDYRDDMDEMVRHKYGFHIDKHDIVFQGICSKCEKNTSK